MMNKELLTQHTHCADTSLRFVYEYCSCALADMDEKGDDWNKNDWFTDKLIQDVKALSSEDINTLLDHMGLL